MLIDKRPINKNPLSIHLPITALASIKHRISGFVLFLAIPLLLWALQQSLASPSGFELVCSFFASYWMKLVIWLSLASLGLHCLLGLRHLLMDIHIADSLKSARFSAWLSLILGALLAIWLAFYIGSQV
jgi:succinate dehydrogenase / fumarate reductase cytochrome b subunit